MFYDLSLLGLSKILKGTFVYAPVSAVAYGINVFILSYLSTILSPEEYVELSFLRTTGLLVLPLVTFSLNLLLPKLSDRELGLLYIRNALYTLSILSSFLVFIFYYIFLSISGSQFHNLLFSWLPVTLFQITLVYVQTTYLTLSQYGKAAIFSFLSIIPIVVTGIGLYWGYKLEIVLYIIDSLALLLIVFLYKRESLALSFVKLKMITSFFKEVIYVIGNNSIYPITFLIAPIIILKFFGNDGMYHWEVTNLWRNMIMVGGSISLMVIQREFLRGGFTWKDHVGWFLIFCTLLIVAATCLYIVVTQVKFLSNDYRQFMLDGIITGVISAMPGFWAFHFFSNVESLKYLIILSTIWSVILGLLIFKGIVFSLLLSYLVFLFLILLYYSYDQYQTILGRKI